jgi:poly-gamma-glutamate capsule biosynthesis protein CapA/YwtB (metallophosphatase superfamily)
VKRIIRFFNYKNFNPGFNRLFNSQVLLTVAVTLIVLDYAEAAQKPDTKEMQTIVAVGDIMLSGSAKPLLRKKGYDYSFSDQALSELVMNADLATANLECPVIKKGVAYKGKKFVFSADPASIKAIKKAGFDMLSLANNHIMDYGEEGLSSTINCCLKSGIVCSGAGADLALARKAGILKRKGITFGLLSYSMTYPEEFWATSDSAGAAYGDKNAVIEDIQKTKKEADVVIVNFHWGEELAESPKAYQVAMAHLAVDSGADIVVGHHPHVPQPIEIYKGKPVFYSLGNYAFGSYSKKTPIGFAAVIVLGKDRICNVRIYPVITDNYEIKFKPASTGNKRAKEIILYLDKISQPFGTGIIYENGIGIVNLGKPL